MKSLGTLTLVGYHFPIYLATFRRITDDGQGHPGWEFNICTQPPREEPEVVGERLLFTNGVRFYSEGDPIPLPDVEDFTGVELFLKEPFDPESGEVYFTLFAVEHEDVSDVTLRFEERRRSEYRISVAALAHHLFKEPVKLEIDTWIKQLPSGKYGETV